MKTEDMHSTAELKRQYEAAKSKAQQAKDAEREAGNRYVQRLISDKLTEYAAMGIKPGDKVIIVRTGWGDDRKVAGFGGVEADGYFMDRVKTIFLKIKKDGTVSKAKHSIYYFDAIEPFVEKPQARSQLEERSDEVDPAAKSAGLTHNKGSEA